MNRAEGNGQAFVRPTDAGALRTVAWTNYHPKEDSYARIDYLLISRNLVPDWLAGYSYVLATPGWGHRLGPPPHRGGLQSAWRVRLDDLRRLGVLDLSVSCP